MPEPFPVLPNLTIHLRELLAQVPAGRVTTCGDLAEALGNRIAARWVGTFALHHPHDANCPCHRIVRVGGELGGYAAGSIRNKTRKLTQEGVTVRQGTVDLARFGLREFTSARPLEELKKVQEAIQRRIIIRPRRRMPKLVGGVDVAYPQPDMGVAAYALVETATGRLVWSTTVRRRVTFPYISTYLSFREIPILLDLLDAVRAAGRMAEVLLVDGSGILHHRHAGIASHLGVVAGLPTVGVTKKLLCGRVDVKEMAPGESRPVWDCHPERSEGSPPSSGQILRFAQDDRRRNTHAISRHQLIGVALRPTAGSLRPIFLSPGHRVDVAFCEQLVRQLLAGRRLPEPIYWADRIGKHPSVGQAEPDPSA